MRIDLGRCGDSMGWRRPHPGAQAGFSGGVGVGWRLGALDLAGCSSDLCPTLVLADSPTPRASGSWWSEGPSTAWALCSSRATGGSPSPTPSGISLWHLVLVPTTMPSGGTSICPAPCRPRCPSEVVQTARDIWAFGAEHHGKRFCEL